jgi:DNA-binding CsgD family transcriptional regulator
MGSADDRARPDPSLLRGREHFERREWRAAIDELSSVDPRRLPAPDGERLAVAAWLVGDDDRCDDAWARAGDAHARAGDTLDAARCAFWLGLALLLRGDGARASGWLGRARTLSGHAGESAVAGLLLVVEGLGVLGTDPVAALAVFDHVHEIGRRCGDADVVAFALLGRGQSLIANGEIASGTACLDEAMVAVVADEVSPVVAGIVYCAVLLECRNTFDARRAREWTGALTRWCETQPDLVAYRGQCLVHRSEVLQFEGRWNDALAEARRACERLAGHPAIGEAYYQQAEMHRLRGEHAAADAAYRAAAEFGRDPQPGLALLRLAQGDVTAARASIRRIAGESRPPGDRCRILVASAEIALALDDHDTARSVADELDAVASTLGAPMLTAEAMRVRGAVQLVTGDVTGAAASLRSSLRLWLELGAPYEAARVRVLLGRAAQALGDGDSARLELDVARACFEALGATPDLAGFGDHRPTATAAAGLTRRELEVLRLVTTGRTNHDIATELLISDHTVRRHLQNIFHKIGVSTRAAATAYAFEHGLV